MALVLLIPLSPWDLPKNWWLQNAAISGLDCWKKKKKNGQNKTFLVNLLLLPYL